MPDNQTTLHIGALIGYGAALVFMGFGLGFAFAAFLVSHGLTGLACHVRW